jgi:integrase
LYVRKIENSKVTKRSLEIDLSEIHFNKFFNTKTQRFRKDKSFSNGNNYNDIIDIFFENLKTFNNDLEIVPNNRKSFVGYWERLIQTTENHGSKIKHQVILNKLTKYLISVTKNDLLFKEITPQFIRELRLYLVTTKDPKRLGTNSVNHYLKVIKSIINHAQKDGYYIYIIHPFLSISFKNEQKTKGVITEKELGFLQETYIEDPIIDLARKMFLFQLFSNGLRVSDLLLLRWNNLVEGGRLKYKMFKTDELISIPININISLILAELLNKKDRYNQLIENLTTSVYLNGEEVKLTISQIEDHISKVAGRIENLSGLDVHKVENNQNLIQMGGYFYEQKNQSKFIHLIKSKEELISLIDLAFTTSLMGAKNKKKQIDFVFPVLKNNEFNNVDSNNDFTKITEAQYKKIKHATIFYNRKLKIVAEICRVDTNLSSHVARHSFTNLLLNMDNVNLYDISQSLGHKTITITQNYIQSGFNNKKIDYLNRDMANKHRKKN